MRLALALVLLAAFASAEVFFQESFDDADWSSRWIQSNSRSDYGSFELTADHGLRTSQDYRFYGLSAGFGKFSNKGKELVLQFTVRHPQKLDCGGGYLKLLPSTVALAGFNGDAHYHVMFGPDICGYGTRRIHLIFHYKGQNLLWKKEPKPETDELTHAYTLHLFPDNTYAVALDGKTVESGALADDWAFLKPREIPDPAASKPADWVDDATIADPDDTKPADWDDHPAEIPDPDAAKPADWDDDNDGEWEAPLLANPEYKGPWAPRMIPNPAYKGPWVHPLIPNPDFEDDASLAVYEDIAAVGIDIWQVKSGSVFDNILLTDDAALARAFVDGPLKAIQDAERKEAEELEAKRRKDEDDARRKEELEDAQRRNDIATEEKAAAAAAADDHDHDHDHDHPHHDEL